MVELNTLEQTWLIALEGVRFGSFSSRKRFLETCLREGVRTDRQRWWLAKLVVMYRRQIRSDFAVATASAYVDAHPEHDLRRKPKTISPPRTTRPLPVPQRNLDLFGNWT